MMSNCKYTYSIIAYMFLYNFSYLKVHGNRTFNALTHTHPYTSHDKTLFVHTQVLFTIHKWHCYFTASNRTFKFLKTIPPILRGWINQFSFCISTRLYPISPCCLASDTPPFSFTTTTEPSEHTTCIPAQRTSVSQHVTKRTPSIYH